MEANHILIVEDDKEIREGVEIYLRSQGYEVFQAADGYYDAPDGRHPDDNETSGKV